jgi:2-polyprenyl-3-methyl-5-hydroxy-6-metoxy-1,4-benzoquinol methylase
MEISQLQWEKVPCDWCGTAGGEKVFSGPDRLLHLPGEFHLVRCPNCGIIRQNPRLQWESLKDYYPEDYDSYAPLLRDEPSRLKRLDRRYGIWKRLRLVERHQRSGRLLDIGAGTGIFLEEVIRSGRWQAEGVEPTQRAAQYAQDALQVPIHQGLFSDIPLEEAAYDTITLWHVLEHVPHPIEDLRYAHKLLKPGGYLVFAIPNAESLDARVFGPYWLGWDLPRHLYILPQASLEAILPEMGYQIVDRRCFATTYAAIRHDLDFWSQTWEINHPTLRRLLLGIYNATPIRLGLSPFYWILDRLKLSPIITIIAKKVA